jgi:predicted dienelactone hydrolase
MNAARTGAALACAAAALGYLSPAASPHAKSTRPVERHVFRFVDRSRHIRLPGGKQVARPVETVVWYPGSAGPDPLIVFGHGFTLTPGPYEPLLRAWAAACYVVAAPVFPLGNADAPGGPSEADLPNQPKDVSFVITRLLALDARAGPLHGKIDASRIAVAGHSDGAETALAAAYDRRYRDPRIRAAIVLSGATLPGMGAFPRHGPPLLAVQGTVDPINPPAVTAAYFRRAHRPKFLLWLLGASHLPPYTSQQPQLEIVERATVAFLDHYLEHAPLQALAAAGRRPGLTRLIEQP